MGSFHQLSPTHAVSARCFQDKHVSLWAARASVTKEANLLSGPRKESTSAQDIKGGFALLELFMIWSTNLLITAMIY